MPTSSPLVELLSEVDGTGVGACRAQLPAVIVSMKVLDTWASRVQVLPSGGDALLEQALASAVEGALPGRPVGDRTGRGHAETLLVLSALGVGVQITRRLVRPGEPRADHHRRCAGGKRESNVARVPQLPVGPDMLAEVPRGLRAFEDRRELRAADARHHAGRAHGTGADAHLEDVGACIDQVAGPIGRHDVPGDHGNRRESALTAAKASSIRR